MPKRSLNGRDYVLREEEKMGEIEELQKSIDELETIENNLIRERDELKLALERIFEILKSVIKHLDL